MKRKIKFPKDLEEMIRTIERSPYCTLEWAKNVSRRIKALEKSNRIKKNWDEV